jgi:hypothetical protein
VNVFYSFPLVRCFSDEALSDERYANAIFSDLKATNAYVTGIALDQPEL